MYTQSDLYTIDEPSETLVTNTCKLVGHDLINTLDSTYQDMVEDLCHCMLAAIAVDDPLGKQAIGAALHTLLTSVLSIQE